MINQTLYHYRPRGDYQENERTIYRNNWNSENVRMVIKYHQNYLYRLIVGSGKVVGTGSGLWMIVDRRELIVVVVL